VKWVDPRRVFRHEKERPDVTLSIVAAASSFFGMVLAGGAKMDTVHLRRV